MFGDLNRRPDGSFPDSALVGLLKTGTDTVAGAFGARNIPHALKVIEILGIQQGREWGMASLNEFRSFFHLKSFTSFDEINSDPGVAEACEFHRGKDSVCILKHLEITDDRTQWRHYMDTRIMWSFTLA